MLKQHGKNRETNFSVFPSKLPDKQEQDFPAKIGFMISGAWRRYESINHLIA